jgi:undecaprenyl diphosphate synthase
MAPTAQETETSPRVPLTKAPQHVAIIMDGNGRWAAARGLPRAAGHRAGTESLRVVLRAAVEFGVPVLTVYAFSTENWERPRLEVNALLTILDQVIENELDELDASGVQIRHLGRKEGLAPRLVQKIQAATARTAHNSSLCLNVAFNYGGRAEIVDVVRRIVADGLPPDAIDETTISRYLTTHDLPDPDLIIRTGGDMRVSNFLLWQGAYAEFYSTPTFWPDFGRDEFYHALLAYQQRQRRFGRVESRS